MTSIDWRTYSSLHLGSKMPKIQSVLINRSNEEATGAGETTITVVAAVVGNAIFDVAGARIRQVPYSRQGVQAALAS